MLMSPILQDNHTDNSTTKNFQELLSSTNPLFSPAMSPSSMAYSPHQNQRTFNFEQLPTEQNLDFPQFLH
jgi:hypothetical protein